MKTLTVDERLAALERKTFRLRFICGIQLALLAIVWFSSSQIWQAEAKDSVSILRARGLIIEDSLGHPRILMGAPFPKVSGRARQDSTTTAMVFLDEKGHDRLTLGEEPEPQVAGKVLTTVHRIAPGFGVVIHDGDGNERGAYGWLANGRALITLDRPGLDAWAAIVDDKTGFAGMRIEYAPDVARDSTGIEIGTKDSNAFFRLKDAREKDRAVVQLDKDGTTTFKTLDSTGNTIRNLDLSEPTR
jgi:hypothetical protein